MERLLNLQLGLLAIFHVVQKTCGVALSVEILEPRRSTALLGPTVQIRTGLKLSAEDAAAVGFPLALQLCSWLIPDLASEEPVWACYDIELSGAEGEITVPLDVAGSGWYSPKVEAKSAALVPSTTTSRVFVAAPDDVQPTCLPVSSLPESTAKLYEGSRAENPCVWLDAASADHLQAESAGRASAEGQEPPLIFGIAWKVGGGFGWGTAGLNIALTRRALSVPLHTTVSEGLSAEQAEALLPSWRRAAALSRNLVDERGALVTRHWEERTLTSTSDALSESGGGVVSGAGAKVSKVLHLPFPVVHCLGKWGPDLAVDTIIGTFAGALSYWGTVNVGIIFAEATDINARDAALLRRLDLVLAGSSWNRDALLAAGVPAERLGLFLQGVDTSVFFQKNQLQNNQFQKNQRGKSSSSSAMSDGNAGGASTEMCSDDGSNVCDDDTAAAAAASASESENSGGGVAEQWRKPAGELWLFSGGKLEFRKAQDLVVAAFKQLKQQVPRLKLAFAWRNQANVITENHVTIAYSPYTAGHPDRYGNETAVTENGSVTAVTVAGGALDFAGWLERNGVAAADAVDLGGVPHSAMAAVLREMDVAVFPNRCEGGTNLVAMEAIAVGVPTVISANTGHLDLIAHVKPENLWILPTGRDLGNLLSTALRGATEALPKDVETAVLAVFNDPAEAAKRAAAAAEQMRSWDWADSVAGLVAGMKAAAAARRAAFVMAEERRYKVPRSSSRSASFKEASD